eukprot:PITA_27875
MKSAFASSKGKSISLKVTEQVIPPKKFVMSPTRYYNIVEEMKKSHAHISLFELTNIVSQQDMFLRTLRQFASTNNASSQKGSESGKKKYETNAKVVNTLLGSLSQLEFVKVMQLKSSKEIWDKIVLSYQGDSEVKRAKLQTLRIQYEALKMHNDESIASYFLRIDEVVNRMKNLGEEIKEVTLAEKVLRSLSASFQSKVSAIKEK